MNSGRRQGFWRLRPLAGFAAAFCLLAAVWLAFGWLPAVILFVISGPCAVLVRDRTTRFALLGIACGMVWVTCWWAFSIRPISHLTGRGGVYTVELTDYAESKVSFSLASGRTIYNGREYGVQVYLTDGSAEFGPGDRLILEGSLTCTGTEDRYNSPEGTWLTLSQTGSCTCQPGSPRTIRQHLNAWNRKLGDRVEQLFSGDAAGLLRALLTGDRSGLPAGVTADFARSGLSHIAAVSGLHLSILAGLFVKAFGQKTGRALAIPVLVLFTAFTGFSPSALRALTLWCFLFAAWSLRRKSDSMTALLCALLLQVMQNPCALMSVSLQLSFGAVSGLVLLAPACADLQPPRKRWSLSAAPGNLLRILLGGLLTTFSATVFILPLLLYYFGSFSLLAPVTNLLTLWAVAPAMILGGAAVCIEWIFPGAAAVAAIPGELLLRWILQVAQRVSDFPFAALTEEFMLTWLGAGILVLLGITAVSCSSFRHWIPKLNAALAASLLLLGAYQTAYSDLVILDSSRGALTLTAVTEQGSLVLDPGPYAGGAMAERLAENLWSRGVAELDYVVATGTHVSRAGALPQLCSLTAPGVIAAPQDAYLMFDTDPDNGYILPEQMAVPGGSLAVLACGRADRSCWRLQLEDLTILSVCGAQPRPFLALNSDADLSCDILLLDSSFLAAPTALKQLLNWCRPGTVILPADGYTDPASLRQLWQGELLLLEDGEQHIFTLWRD